MRVRNGTCRHILVVSLLLAGVGTRVQGQDQERMTVQAAAMGTSTQMGKMVHINIHID